MNEFNLNGWLNSFKGYGYYNSKIWKGLHNGKYITPDKADKIMGDLYNDMIVHVIQMEDYIKQQDRYIQELKLRYSEISKDNELQKCYVSSLQNALNVTINKNKGIIDK